LCKVGDRYQGWSSDMSTKAVGLGRRVERFHIHHHVSSGGRQQRFEEWTKTYSDVTKCLPPKLAALCPGFFWSMQPTSSPAGDGRRPSMPCFCSSHSITILSPTEAQNDKTSFSLREFFSTRFRSPSGGGRTTYCKVSAATGRSNYKDHLLRGELASW
jgi:hypothetical protein